MTVDAGKRVGRPFFPDDPFFFIFLIVFVQGDIGIADHPEFLFLNEFFDLTQLGTGGDHRFESGLIEFTRHTIDHIRAPYLVTCSFFRFIFIDVRVIGFYSLCHYSFSFRLPGRALLKEIWHQLLSCDKMIVHKKTLNKGSFFVKHHFRFGRGEWCFFVAS